MTAPETADQGEGVGLAEVLAAHRESWQSDGDYGERVWLECADADCEWNDREALDDIQGEQAAFTAHVAAAVLAAGWVRAEDVAALVAEVEAYRADDLREREWVAACEKGNVRCPRCDLRYAERDEYGCQIAGQGHNYDPLELAEAGQVRPPRIQPAAALRPVDAPEVGGRGE